MRELHKWETDEACIVAIENLISLLISDEPEKGLEDLHKVVITEDLKNKFSNVDINKWCVKIAGLALVFIYIKSFDKFICQCSTVLYFFVA